MENRKFKPLTYGHFNQTTNTTTIIITIIYHWLWYFWATERLTVTSILECLFDWSETETEAIANAAPVICGWACEDRSGRIVGCGVGRWCARIEPASSSTSIQLDFNLPSRLFHTLYIYTSWIQMSFYRAHGVSLGEFRFQTTLMVFCIVAYERQCVECVNYRVGVLSILSERVWVGGMKVVGLVLIWNGMEICDARSGLTVSVDQIYMLIWL